MSRVRSRQATSSAMPLPVPPEIEATMKIRGGKSPKGRPVDLGRRRQPGGIERGLERLAEPLFHALEMVHKRQSPQGTQTLRLLRARNVVDPPPAQPLEVLARLAAVIGRLAQGEEDHRVVARARPDRPAA